MKGEPVCFWCFGPRWMQGDCYSHAMPYSMADTVGLCHALYDWIRIARQHYALHAAYLGLKKSEQQPFLTYYKAQMQPGELAAQEAAKKTRKKSGSSSPKRSYNLRKLEGLMKRFPIKTSSSNA
eukprot:TRINITY_DN11107_c0_g1_i2.p1 TRINITY_DN11107_c0_g1~~TRINITY_DN11107_c0_g1_i2.p1  ORF type:complete len:124 (+),score=10.95 TRINITY_DN11107_c0_g1_i2:154-525(+)